MRSQAYDAHGLEAMDANGPRLLFAEHHAGLRRAGLELLARAHEDDCFALVAEYRNFERQVLEHIAAEEELILPELERADAQEAASIRMAHGQIRKQLERIAIDVELHSVRLAAIEELLRTLDEHARREDQRMYPWAQVHLPISNRTAITRRLLASLRELASTR